MLAQRDFPLGLQRSRWGLALGVCAAHAGLLWLGLMLGGKLDVRVPVAPASVSWLRLLPARPVAPPQVVRRPQRDRRQAPSTVPLAPTTQVAALTRASPSRPAVQAPAALGQQAAAAEVIALSPVALPSSAAVPSPTGAASAAPPVVALLVTRAPQAAPGNVMPAYPTAAREDGLEGRVGLRVLVDAQGQVRQVDWARRSGIALLDLAARDAVRLWRFLPALQAGQPVAGSVELVIRFELGNPLVQLALAAGASR